MIQKATWEQLLFSWMQLLILSVSTCIMPILYIVYDSQSFLRNTIIMEYYFNSFIMILKPKCLHQCYCLFQINFVFFINILRALFTKMKTPVSKTAKRHKYRYKIPRKKNSFKIFYNTQMYTTNSIWFTFRYVQVI